MNNEHTTTWMKPQLRQLSRVDGAEGGSYKYIVEDACAVDSFPDS